MRCRQGEYEVGDSRVVAGATGDTADEGDGIGAGLVVGVRDVVVCGSLTVAEIPDGAFAGFARAQWIDAISRNSAVIVEGDVELAVTNLDAVVKIGQRIACAGVCRDCEFAVGVVDKRAFAIVGHSVGSHLDGLFGTYGYRCVCRRIPAIGKPRGGIERIAVHVAAKLAAHIF